MTLGDVIGGVGYALDTPRALAHGAIGNLADLAYRRNRVKGWRASGREMLESLGALGENQEGLDVGDAAGLGVELALDPMNLVGGLGFLKKLLQGKKIAKVAKQIEASNEASRILRKKGAMPEEIAEATKWVDEWGAPRKFYHDTAAARKFKGHQFLEDPGTGNYLGKGIYGMHAKGEAGEMYRRAGFDKSQTISKSGKPAPLRKGQKKAMPPRTVVAFLDTRQPYIFEKPMSIADIRMAGRVIPRKQLFLELKNLKRPYGNIKQDILDIQQEIARLQTLAPQTAQELAQRQDDIYRLQKSLRVTQGMDRKYGQGARPLSKGDLWNLLRQDKSPDELTDVLKSHGYDAISHEAGTGTKIVNRAFEAGIQAPDIDEHSEIVAFLPKQLYRPRLAERLQQVPRTPAVAPYLANALGYNLAARGGARQ